jgi:hypothetical protein
MKGTTGRSGTDSLPSERVIRSPEFATMVRDLPKISQGAGGYTLLPKEAASLPRKVQDLRC